MFVVKSIELACLWIYQLKPITILLPHALRFCRLFGIYQARYLDKPIRPRPTCIGTQHITGASPVALLARLVQDVCERVVVCLVGNTLEEPV